MNKILIIIITFFTVLMIGVVVLVVEKSPKNKEKVWKTRNYSGIIISKTYLNMGDAALLVKNNSKEFFVIVHDFEDELWNYSEITDSIIKIEGELYLTIKKRSGKTKSFNLKDKKKYGFIIPIIVFLPILVLSYFSLPKPKRNNN